MASAARVEIGQGIMLNGWWVGNWPSRQREGIKIGSSNNNEIIFGMAGKPGHVGVIITP